MTITKEKINGVEHTIVWHDGGEPFWMPSAQGWNGHGMDYESNTLSGLIATALPPLPRNPQPSDAALLYLYAAQGLMVVSEVIGNDSNRTIHSYVFVGSGRKGIYTEKNPPYDCTNHLDWFANYPITHALHNGARVEIAITDNE